MSIRSTHRIVATLESGEVLRYHAAPGVTKQTDAAHQWGVAMLGLYICPGLPRETLIECLMHDTGELITGDIPYTAKMIDPEFKRQQGEMEIDAREEHMLPSFELSARGHALLKICDTLEGLVWCAKEEHSRHAGIHRGQVFGRWCEAYVYARQKFMDFLTTEEWERADSVFARFSGKELTPMVTEAAE